MKSTAHCTVLHRIHVAWALMPLDSNQCHRFDQTCWAACRMPTLSSGTVGTKCWNWRDWSGQFCCERPILQSEAPPIEHNDCQLGLPAGREGVEMVAGAEKPERMGQKQRGTWEEEGGCRNPKISKRSRKWLKMLQDQVAVGKSGQHTASIWLPLCSPGRGDERLYTQFWFFCSQLKVNNCFTMTLDHLLEDKNYLCFTKTFIVTFLL